MEQGAAVLRPCPLSPEKCPLKNPKPPPKMMPCFKFNWGYFSAQAQLTAATCRPDIIARVAGFLELTREQGSFRVGLSPTWLGHHGCHGLGLPRAPSLASGECFKGHPGIKSQLHAANAVSYCLPFSPKLSTPSPLRQQTDLWVSLVQRSHEQGLLLLLQKPPLPGGMATSHPLLWALWWWGRCSLPEGEGPHPRTERRG